MKTGLDNILDEINGVTVPRNEGIEPLTMPMSTKGILDYNKGPKVIKVYTDGGCINNPGEAGSGIAILEDDEWSLYYGRYETLGTNNTAELKALYKALLIVLTDEREDVEYKIYSDSQYSIDAITKWSYGWSKNGWLKRNGETVSNVEIIKIAFELFAKLKKAKRNFSVNKVKGHSGVIGNELADRMATVAMNKGEYAFTEYDYTDIDDVLDM